MSYLIPTVPALQSGFVRIAEDALPVTVFFPSEMTPEDCTHWYHQQEAYLNRVLLEKGAILFRNTGIDSAPAFEAFVDRMGLGGLDYKDGTSPRTKLASKVYTSTEYDQSQAITLHNELSYSAKWPARILFCCTIPATTGGETPIADSREILRQMNSDLVEEIERKQIRYIRNLNNGLGFGLSWQKAFETQDRRTVETFCQAHAIRLEWKKDGGARLIQLSPGIISHPLSGERVWFNQVDQFHPSHLNPETYETLMMLYDTEMDLPTFVTFGDGSSISAAAIQEIHGTINKLAVANPWHRGDLLLLDNVLTCHGRMPYTGERKVLVSMA
jgi:alpha-ketoglutarate-dependent taurine dioxygenase